MNRQTLLVGLCMLVFSIGCKTKEKEKEESGTFTVTSPLMKDTLIYKEYVGQIQSINHIELRSQEKGYLQKIFVDEGQYVKKGQLLFQIMPVVYEAEYQKAVAEANYADIEYKNTKSLADKNIVSANELALAKAKLEKAKADMALSKAHLDFTEIRAPFDGIMGRFLKRLGSLIDEGELLTTLADNSKMWVYFNVPESEYLNLVKSNQQHHGQEVQLRMANDVVFEHKGMVETIEADFNNETGNIAFRATFPNPGSLLRHGETGTILMPVSLKNAILIPQKSTFDVLDKKYVYVVDANNVVQARLITVAQEMSHLYVVGSGLAVGDKIVAEGLGKVKNNEKIQYRFVPVEKELSESNQLHAE